MTHNNVERNGDNVMKKSGAEVINPYNDRTSKGEQVEQMFDAIAPAYDFMNAAMSLGQHHRWRDTALKMAAEDFGRRLDAGRGFSILDVATGTGDVAFRMHEMWPEASVTGIDLSDGMLEVGRKKLAGMDSAARARISFVQGDCLALPFADCSFDIVTVAYGVRNFEHLEAGLREMYRVLKPGGVLCIIELSCPRNPLLLAGYTIYTRCLIPAVGRLVSGDNRAYTYLPESIAAAPQRHDMTALMQRAGFRATRYRALTMGTVCVYTGRKTSETIAKTIEGV